jgi:hypothetical protein
MQDICTRAYADTHADASLSISKPIQLRQEVAEARTAVCMALETRPPPENFKMLQNPSPHEKEKERTVKGRKEHSSGMRNK